MNRLNLPPIRGVDEWGDKSSPVARLDERRQIAKALREDAERRRREAEVFGGSGHYFAASELWVQAKAAEAYAAELDPDTKERP